MFPILDFDPVPEPAAAIDALAVLRDHALQPHQAGVAEQVRADLALLERPGMPSTRRANSRASWSCAFYSGSLRRSSPSLSEMSKAYNCTSARAGANAGR